MAFKYKIELRGGSSVIETVNASDLNTAVSTAAFNTNDLIAAVVGGNINITNRATEELVLSNIPHTDFLQFNNNAWGNTAEEVKDALNAFLRGSGHTISNLIDVDSDLNGIQGYGLVFDQQGKNLVLSASPLLNASYNPPPQIETDPVFTASPAYSITNTNKSNWNTAYGWGDHATAGYVPETRTLTINGTTYDLSADRAWTLATTLVALTDTAISNPALGELLRYNGSTWENWSPNYLTAETDPVYTASSWYSTTNNSANWDTAYGWGDHSTAGYVSNMSTNAGTADVFNILNNSVFAAVDAGADKLVYWDDGNNKLTHLTLGTNLTITGGTLNASGGSQTLAGLTDTSITSPGAGEALVYNNDTSIWENAEALVELKTSVDAWIYSGNSYYMGGAGSLETNPLGIYFKPDGTRMFISGRNDDRIKEFSLSTAWDITTSSYVQESGALNSIGGSIAGLFFKSDGTKAYLLEYGNDRIGEWTLSTPWDVSTMGSLQYYDTTNDGYLTPYGLDLKPDGTEVYLATWDAKKVVQYTMSTAFDISTLSFTREFDVSNETSQNVNSVRFAGNGTRMIIHDNAEVFLEYTLSTAWDISTATFLTESLAPGPNTTQSDFFYYEGGDQVFVIADGSDTVYEYSTKNYSSSRGLSLGAGISAGSGSLSGGVITGTSLNLNAGVITAGAGTFSGSISAGAHLDNSGRFRGAKSNAQAELGVYNQQLGTSNKYIKIGGNLGGASDMRRRDAYRHPLTPGTYLIELGARGSFVTHVEGLTELQDVTVNDNLIVYGNPKVEDTNPTATGTTIYNDTFTETSDTALGSHTSDSGHTYSTIFDDTGGNGPNLTVFGGTGQAGMDQSIDNEGQTFVSSAVTSGVDYELVWNYQVDLTGINGSDLINFAFGVVDSNNYFLLCAAWGSGGTPGGNSSLIRVTNGVGSEYIADPFSYHSLTITSNTAYDVKIKLVDRQHYIYHDNTLVWSGYIDGFPYDTDHGAGIGIGDRIYSGNKESHVNYKFNSVTQKEYQASDFTYPNSYIENGNFGIGTTTPSEALSVQGQVEIKDSSSGANILVNAGTSAITSGTNHIGIGNGTGQYFIGGSNSIAIGNDASAGGVGNHIAIGPSSGRTSSLTSGYGDLISIGRNAGRGHSWYNSDTVAIGQGAMGSGSGSSNSVALGKEALYQSTFQNSHNIAIGQRAMRISNGNNNVAIGQNAMSTITGSSNIGIGPNAGGTYNSGRTYSSSISIGAEAGQNMQGDYNVLVGREAGKGNSSTFANTVAVGYQALTALTTGTGNTAVGYQAGDAITTGNNNTLFGYSAGGSMTGSSLTAIGYEAGRDVTTSTSSTLIGYRAGASHVGHTNHTVVGANAGNIAGSGNDGTVIGASAYISGSNQTAVGAGAATTDGGTSLGAGARAGSYGVAIGQSAGSYSRHNSWSTHVGRNSGNDGKYSVALGANSLSAANTSSYYNVALGYEAGSGITSGGSNILIGYQAGSTLTTESNKLYIENSNSTTPLIYGEFDNDILRVNGTLQVNDPASTGYAFPTATGTLGQVLEVDANGDLIFATPSGGGGGSSQWTTTGSDIYYNTGNVGIGTTTPAQPLHVDGNAKINGILDLRNSLDTDAGVIQVTDTSANNVSVGIGNMTSVGIRHIGIGEINSTSRVDYVGIGPRGVGGGNQSVVIGDEVAGNNGSLAIVAIGQNSSRFASGNYSVGIGVSSLYNTGALGAAYTVAVGQGAGSSQSGTYNSLLGKSAGSSADGSYSLAAGAFAGANMGENSVALGAYAAQGDATSTFSSTVAVGYQALTALTTGTNNTAVGHQSADALTTGSANTVFGNSAGGSITNQSNNTLLGYQAGSSTTSGNNTLVGYRSGLNSTNGNNTLLGYSAGQGTGGSSTFSNTVAVGYEALKALTTGGSNTALGDRTSRAITSGSGNTSVGILGLSNVTTTSNNTSVGAQALQSTTGANNTAVGFQSGNSITTNGENALFGYTSGIFNTGAQNVAIGSRAMYGSPGASTVGSTVAVGYQALTALTTGAGNTAVGYQAGNTLTSNNNNTLFGYQVIAGGSDNTAFGYQAMNSVSGDTRKNVAVGSLAGVRTGVSVGNVFVGYNAGNGGSGDNNIFLGESAGMGSTGSDNIGFGSQTGRNATGTRNVWLGRSIGYVPGSVSYSVVVGYDAKEAENVVAVGYQAGNSSSAYSVFLGYQAGASETNSNRLYIENSNSTAPLIYGEFDNDLIRVNGDLEVKGYADVELGASETFTIHDGTHDLFQVDTGTTGVLFSVNDVSGLPKLEVDEDEGVIAKSIKVDDGALTAAGQYGKGAEIWYQGTGTTQAGSVCYLNSSGDWTKTNATSTTNAIGMLAVAAGSDSDVDGMVTRGFVYVTSDPGGNVGDVVYLSAATDGLLTTTAPTGTTGFVVRVVGHKVGTNIIYFNPSNDWIELA